MEAIAKLRNLKGSPQKTRLVIDLIRGRNVSQALSILKFTNKRAADPITKVLRSAIANATYAAEQQNIAIDPDDLFVKTCFVDMGPHKNRSRMRPAPQGRAFREHRHYCHITVLLSSDKPAPNDDHAPTRKKGKKLLAKEAGNVETTKASAKSAKKAEKADDVVEEKVIVTDPVAEMMDTKEAEVEAPAVEETAGNVVPDENAASEQEVFNEQAAENKEQAADAKDAPSQRTVEINATQKADEAQLDENEQLERQ